MDNLLTQSITYGALERTLLMLGFQEETYETHRLYKKAERGAVIVLPRDTELDEKVRAVHLLTARHTIVGMDIAEEAELEALLAANREPGPEVFPAGRSQDPHPRSQTRQQDTLAALSIKAH